MRLNAGEVEEEDEGEITEADKEFAQQ